MKIIVKTGMISVGEPIAAGPRVKCYEQMNERTG